MFLPSDVSAHKGESLFFVSSSSLHSQKGDGLCPPSDVQLSLTPTGQNLCIKDLNKNVVYKLRNKEKGKENAIASLFTDAYFHPMLDI